MKILKNGIIMKTLENGMIIVDSLNELKKIVKTKEIPLDLIDIKNSNLKSLEGLFAYINEINGSIENWLHTSKHSFGISFLDSKNTYNKQLLYFTKLTLICKQIIFNFYFYLTSNIISLEATFWSSNFNGNLSKWDVSNVISMLKIFTYSAFNNNSISNWNISNCKYMNEMFYHSPFDCDISSWKFNNNVNVYCIFKDNKNFENKYNNGKRLPIQTKNFLEWFENNRDENNRDKIKEINQGTKEEVLDFFSFDKKELDLN